MLGIRDMVHESSGLEPRAGSGQNREIRDLLLTDFTYVDMTRSMFLRSAEIHRVLRKKGKTIRSPADCLIAACVLEERAALLEDDADFHAIAEVTPLKLFRDAR